MKRTLNSDNLSIVMHSSNFCVEMEKPNAIKIFRYPTNNKTDWGTKNSTHKLFKTLEDV